MPSNIKHNSVRSLRFRCRNDEYYDFMLYRGECNGSGTFGNCVVAEINANGLNLEPGSMISREDKDGQPTMYGGEVYSTVEWPGNYSEDPQMKDIGLTGIDNGLIAYSRDRISNRTFVEMYTGTTYTIPSGSTRFYMSPVSGNTKAFNINTSLFTCSTFSIFSCSFLCNCWIFFWTVTHN